MVLFLGLHPGRIQFCGRKGLFTVGGDAFVIDALSFTLRKINEIQIKAKRVGCICKYNETTVAVFDAEYVWFYDVADEKIIMKVPVFSANVEAAISLNGEFYAANAGKIMKLAKA